MMSKHNQ